MQIRAIGLIPTNTPKSLGLNTLGNAGNNFYNNTTKPIDENGNMLTIRQNLTETTFKAMTGTLINGISIPAADVKSFNVVDGLIGVSSNFLDTQIENDVRN